MTKNFIAIVKYKDSEHLAVCQLVKQKTETKTRQRIPAKPHCYPGCSEDAQAQLVAQMLVDHGPVQLRLHLDLYCTNGRVFLETSHASYSDIRNQFYHHTLSN